MEHKICILIIDSDANSVDHIREILGGNSLIERIDVAENSDVALLKVIDSIPDIVLMEFPFKDKTSSELLKLIKTKFTETTVIFIAESKDNAAQAIRNGVYHYLLKPIPKDKLDKIIGQVLLVKQNSVQIKIKQFIEKSTQEKRSMFYTSKGYILIDPDEIILCKADGIFSEMYLTQNRTEIIYLFLSRIEEMLNPNDFIRSNRKFLINKKYIRKVYKNNNSILLFHEGKEYMVKGSKQHIRNLTKLNTD
jgi:two-component system LytT family response regulator